MEDKVIHSMKKKQYLTVVTGVWQISNGAQIPPLCIPTTHTSIRNVIVRDNHPREPPRQTAPRLPQTLTLTLILILTLILNSNPNPNLG